MIKLAKEKGKYGYKDEEGNWVVEPIFMHADEFEGGTARVQIDGFWGFIKEDGSWLVEPTLSNASPFSEELARVQQGFFYGFINRNGEWFIEPKLLKATDFENDTIAFAEDLDSKCAFISNKGKMITDFNLDSMSYGSPAVFMTYNRIRAKKDRKYGFLDSEGNWVVSPIYEEVMNYDEGLAFVKHSSDLQSFPYNLIDLDGKTVLESIDLEAFNFGFENGVAVVEAPAGQDDKNIFVTGKCGVIDREGKWVVAPTFSKIRKFDKGFAITQKAGKQGVIDIDGHVIIDNIYDRVSPDYDYFVVELNKKKGIADKNGKVILPPKYEYCSLRKEGFICIKNKKGYGLADLTGKVVIKPSLNSIPNFDGNDYARVEVDGKYGWINRKGTFLTEQLFDDARDFSEGMAAVKSGKLWGFIDENGNLVIEPQFDVVSQFKNGISTVGISGHWGLISKNGEWITEPKFDEIKEFEGGVAPAKIFNLKARSSKWGMIDESARFVIEPEFEDLENFNGDYARAKANGKWGLIGKDGKWTVEPEFDEIYPFTDAGVAEVRIKNKYGFINTKGEVIVPVEITDEAYFNTVTHYLWAKVKGKWGFLDSNSGRWVIEPKYKAAYAFDSGDALIEAQHEDKWGMIDCRDNWLIPPIFESNDDLSGTFNHGLVRVNTGGKEGFYDVLGKKWALPPIYEKAEYVDKNLFKVKDKNKFALSDSEGQVWDGKWYEDIFKGQGVVWVKENGKYGIMDKNRTWLLPPTFDWVDFNVVLFNRDGIIRVEFDGKRALADTRGNILGGRAYDAMQEYRYGFFKVVDNGKYGLIDKKGNLIIETKYRDAEPFFNGLALAETFEKEYGYISPDGKWAIPARFEWAESFRDKHGGGILNYARAKVDDKYGVIDTKGNWVVEPKFERIGEINNILAVKENGKWGYLRLDGEWILPPVYMEADDFWNGYGSVLCDDFKRLFVDTNGKLYKRKPN